MSSLTCEAAAGIPLREGAGNTRRCPFGIEPDQSWAPAVAEHAAAPARFFLPMNQAGDPGISDVLARGQVIDITTTGRSSGRPRRLEIVFHNIEARIYISGLARPERRGWLANLEADPNFTFHLKGSVKADLRARARIITDEAERRRILEHIARFWRNRDVDSMVAYSPLIEVTIEDTASHG